MVWIFRPEIRRDSKYRKEIKLKESKKLGIYTKKGAKDRGKTHWEVGDIYK